MQIAQNGPIPNKILASLSASQLSRIARSSELVPMKFGAIIHDPGKRISHVYFPTGCSISMLTMAGAEQMSEVGLIGYEGVVGLGVALGSHLSPFRALVQGEGFARRMKVSDFRTEFERNGVFQKAIFRFAHGFMIQSSQTTACNRFHQTAQRLARWLPMTQDRVKSPHFQLTQAFLGYMLATRRVAITEAAMALQKKKLISYSRGNISVLDRPGLEHAACSCYATVKAQAA